LGIGIFFTKKEGSRVHQNRLEKKKLLNREKNIMTCRKACATEARDA